MYFISPSKLSLFIRYLLNIFPEFFGHVGTRLDKKAQVKFKTYDIATWETKLHCIFCPISQEVK